MHVFCKCIDCRKLHASSALLLSVQCILCTSLIDGWFKFHDLRQLKRIKGMYSEHNTSPSSQWPSRGWRGRLGWQRHVQGMTGEDLGWQWVYRGWQREAREDRGHVQGMIGAEKWHRGYVQGVARDGGEVQGMTGMERGFPMGQWILKSVWLLDRAHNWEFYTSLHFNLLSIFICHSVYLSMLFTSF